MRANNSRLRWLLLPFSMLFLLGCGVDFSPEERGSEMFKSLELTGERLVHHELTLTVEVLAAYPVPVSVACFYENRSVPSLDRPRLAFHDRATLIGERVIEAADVTDFSDDARRHTLRFAFSVPQPGDYFAGCLTPGAPDNGISLAFRVRPATDVTAELP